MSGPDSRGYLKKTVYALIATMEMPSFGQPQNQDPYTIPAQQPGNDKKTLLLMVGGLVLVIIILVFVLTRGGGNPGQSALRKTVEHTNNSVGILDEYLGDVGHDNTKNELALALILLRGNQKNLTELYSDTFKGARKLPSNPKPTDEATEKLEAAKRNNILDDEIIKLLQIEIAAATENALDAKPHFTKQASRQTLTTAQDDLAQVADILNQAR